MARRYLAAAGTFFGLQNLPSVLELYPSDTPWTSVNRLSTHVAFSCPAQQIVSAVPGARLYAFIHPPGHDEFNPRGCWGRFSCHAAELSFVFREGATFTTPAEDTLSRAIQSLWTDFARGVPLTLWPPYTNGTQLLRLVTPKPLVSSGYLRAECALIDKLDGPR